MINSSQIPYDRVRMKENYFKFYINFLCIKSIFYLKNAEVGSEYKVGLVD
jgi:hypothetical protein